MGKHRILPVVVALTCSLRCGGSSTTAPPPATSDADRDGVTAAAGDCDDHNAAVNPNATVVAPSCVWQSTQWDCPSGSQRYPEDKDSIFVRVANNQCTALSVVDATVHVTVVEARATFNQANEKWTSEHVRFSPNNLPLGVTGDVEVDGDIVCTNGSGAGGYNVYRAEVVLQTSAGPLRCTTTNTHMTRFPVAGERTPGLEGLSGGRAGR